MEPRVDSSSVGRNALDTTSRDTYSFRSCTVRPQPALRTQAGLSCSLGLDSYQIKYAVDSNDPHGSEFWSNPNATEDWPFISKQALSDLLPQAQPHGEALVIAVAAVLPALPRISLAWAAQETVLDESVCCTAWRMIDVSCAIFNSFCVGGELNACLHLLWAFCVVPEKRQPGLVNAAPGFSGLCQSLNGTHDPHRRG